MNTITELQTKLKSTTIPSKRELLLYIIKDKPDTKIEIVTQAMLSYVGDVIHLGETVNREEILIFQITDEFRNDKGHVLHIAVSKIESIELLDEADVITILSRGTKSKWETYGISGKLEVKRRFKKLSDTIAAIFSINIGTPEMILPADGHSLNRILKLTKIIEETILELLKEEDVLESWKIDITQYDL